MLSRLELLLFFELLSDCLRGSSPGLDKLASPGGSIGKGLVLKDIGGGNMPSGEADCDAPGADVRFWRNLEFNSWRRKSAESFV